MKGCKYNISNCVRLIRNSWDSHSTRSHVHLGYAPYTYHPSEVSKNIKKIKGIMSSTWALLKRNAFMGLKMPHTGRTFVLTRLQNIQHSWPRLSSSMYFLSSVLFIFLLLWRPQRTTEMLSEYLICYSLLERPLNPFIIHIFNLKFVLKQLYELQRFEKAVKSSEVWGKGSGYLCGLFTTLSIGTASNDRLGRKQWWLNPGIRMAGQRKTTKTSSQDGRYPGQNSKLEI